MSHIIITMIICLVLSLVSIAFSGAPLRVYATDISALLIAFVIPSIAANNKTTKSQNTIWLFGAIVGLLYWDALSSFVIVKRELFMGWYIIYPVGLVALFLLQIVTKYINKILPYNEAFKKDAA